MKQLQNKRGTTLVELIVCMVLLSILTLAAVTLIRPSAQAYRDIQLQTRAQNLADALIETIRGEVLGRQRLYPLYKRRDGQRKSGQRV